MQIAQTHYRFLAHIRRSIRQRPHQEQDRLITPDIHERSHRCRTKERVGAFRHAGEYPDVGWIFHASKDFDGGKHRLGVFCS